MFPQEYYLQARSASRADKETLGRFGKEGTRDQTQGRQIGYSQVWCNAGMSLECKHASGVVHSIAYTAGTKVNHLNTPQAPWAPQYISSFA